MSGILKSFLTAALLLTLVSCNQPPNRGAAEEIAVENLTDLLYSSMQSIVSLNELVTQLTQRVAELTISFADTKTNVKMAREDIEDLKIKVSANANLSERIDGLKD